MPVLGSGARKLLSLRLTATFLGTPMNPADYPTILLVLFGVWLLLGLGGLLLLFAGLKGLLQRRLLGGGIRLGAGVLLAAGALAVGGLGLAFQTYDRLTHEQAAVKLHFRQVENQRFVVTLRYPDEEEVRLDLTGDEWQVDARVLRWKGPAIVAGMDALFRIERISGRFSSIQREREGPRSVHALHPEPRTLDPWNLATRYPKWVPWVDAIYGSATYLPMAHQAEFEVVVTQSGLAARPLNEEAERASVRWE